MTCHGTVYAMEETNNVHDPLLFVICPRIVLLLSKLNSTTVTETEKREPKDNPSKKTPTTRVTPTANLENGQQQEQERHLQPLLPHPGLERYAMSYAAVVCERCFVF